MIKLWRLLSISISAAVILGLMLVPAVPNVALAQTLNCGIEVVPSTTKVGYNENFSVNITITDTVVQDIAAWTVYLEFNTTLMHVTGIDPCTMLPTGYAPDDGPGYPKWDNTTGVIDHQSGTSFGEPYVNTSFDVMTVHFRSNNVSGIGSLNFEYINPLKRTWVEDGDALPVLNWTMVVNGTVKVGPPVLTVDVAPAGKGNVTINAVTPPSYPNTTTWSWDEVVNLTAVNSVPNWTFIEWSGDLAGGDNTTSITMNWDKSVTAHFAPAGITATLEGHVGLQGLPATNVTVRFFAPNTTTENVTMKTHLSTDSNGNFTIGNLTPGSYDVAVKGSTSLSNLESGVSLTSGNTTYRDFGVLLEGDATGDDYVDAGDFGILSGAWLSWPGEPNWDARADFSRDSYIDASDFGLLSANWLKWGDCFGWPGNWT